MPLTEFKIWNSQAKEKTCKLLGGGGLYLEILPSGTKSWRVAFKEDGKEVRHTPGRWAHWSEINLRPNGGCQPRR